MYSTIPKQWRGDFSTNVTLKELNNTLVMLHIPTIVLISILMFVGVVGNVFVLCIYSNSKPSTYKVFIIWLGWMDLLECLVGKPVFIISLTYPYMFPSAGLCRSSRFFEVFTVVGAAFIFLAISYERYKKICFLDMHQLSNKRVNVICVLAAMLGCLVAVPALFVYGDAEVDTGVHNITGIECFISPKYTSSHVPKLYFLFQLLLTLITFFTICAFYIRIWRTLRWHRTFIQEHAYTSTAREHNDVVTPDPHHEDLLVNNLNNQSNKGVIHTEQLDNHCMNSENVLHHNVCINLHEMKGGAVGDSHETLDKVQTHKQTKASRNKLTNDITKMLFTVTVVFILSFLPHLVLMVMNSTLPEVLRDLSPCGVVVYNICLRTFVVNNTANPIVYFICLRTFRAKCVGILRRACRCIKWSR